MTLPRITVITPSFNQGEYLEQTIKSIVDQKYPDLEYFVIDGGSTDHSVEIIRQYQHRITYWTSEKDSGQSEAINKGLRRATGSLITWINSDDQLAPDALLRIASLHLDNPEVDLIHGNTLLHFDKDGRKILRGADQGIPYSYLAGMAFPQPSSFFTRRALEKAGELDESLHYGMDFDFFTRIYLQGKFLSTATTFSEYRIHAESKSVTAQASFADDWAIVYSKVLRSFPFTEQIIQRLRLLNLYREGNDRFITARDFDLEFLEKTFLHFINFQIIFFYQSLELSRVRTLTEYLRINHRDFFLENKLNKNYWRSLILPVALIKLFRLR